jgi:hypothetical protein
MAATAVALLLSCSYAQQSIVPTEMLRLPSPDGSLVAVVKSFHKGTAPAESKVELRTRAGMRLAEWSYRSGDGQHGYGVVNAQWTPDSLYFVYSLQSSGGHQPWHSPVQYFSRKSNSFLSLDDALNEAVESPDFGISAPNTVTIDLYSNKTADVSLAALEARK